MKVPVGERVIAPGLYLVATPIGNLEDITMRALRILRGVDKIACEDTRQTSKLLAHYEIETPTVSYHMHNEVGRTKELVAELRAGGKIAVVSDAGMPGIADPGAQVVGAAIGAGISVFPVPGANAALSALIASGMGAERFSFYGFLPAKGGARRSFLEELFKASEAGTMIFYEAPHRIVESLEDVVSVFGAGHGVALGREITKLHEEFLRGSAGEVLAALRGRESVRGEMVLLLSGERVAVGSVASVRAAVSALVGEGMSEKDALKRVAKERGMGKSDAYREWQRGK